MGRGVKGKSNVWTDVQCGAPVKRCVGCDNSVGKSYLRRGRGCPKCRLTAADVFDSTCRNEAKRGQRCWRHGARTPLAREAQARARQRAKVAKVVERRQAADELHRAARAPFAARIAEIERLADLGGSEALRDAERRLKRLRTSVRRVDAELKLLAADLERRRRLADLSDPAEVPAG